MRDHGLLKWVGLDVKALPEHYGQVVGRDGAGARAWESLEQLVRPGTDYEVRTTVVHGDVTAADAVPLARRLRAMGVKSYALQQARALGAGGAVKGVTPCWDEECRDMAQQMVALGWERFTCRPATV